MVAGLAASRNVYDPFENPQRLARDGATARIQQPGTTDTGTTALSEGTAREHDPAELETAQAVSELQSVDAEVRAHEAAHAAAGGSHITGGVSYTYHTGPDGKRYAVGGEVGIDVSPVPGNPQATISKMMMVRAAALAPANPSPQDLAVASAAAQTEAAARAELAAQTQVLIAETQPTGKSVASRYATSSQSAGQHLDAVA